MSEHAGVPLDPAELCGVVLTGGRSRRMGRDKATLTFDGVGLARRAVDALIEAGVGRVVLVGGNAPTVVESVGECAVAARGTSVPVTAVDDVWPGEGPLGGIVSAAEQTSAAGLVVTACDLPFLDADAIRHLIAAAADAPRADGSIGHDGEVAQPLFVVLRRPTFAVMRAAHDDGCRSPKEVWATLNLALAAPLDGWRLRDVDTPEELAAARRELG